MSSTRRVDQPDRVLIWIALCVVYVIWGSTYLAIRVAAESLPAFASAATRFGVAGSLLAIIVAATIGWRSLRVSVRQLAATCLVGVLLLAGGNGLVVLAVSPNFGLPSGVAALLVALTPVLMVVLRAVSGDRPGMATVIGVLVGFAGLAALFLPGVGSGAGNHPVPVLGGVIVLLAVICWCLGSFASRFLPMPANPFVASVWEMGFGAGALALISVLRREPALWAVPDVPPRAWLALAYLIIFGSLVAFTAFVWLLHQVPISLTMTYAYVNPVIALLLGAVLLGEVLTGQVVLAAATVVLGVMLVVSTERPRNTTAEH